MTSCFQFFDDTTRAYERTIDGDALPAPVRTCMLVMRSLWQHVLRRKRTHDEARLLELVTRLRQAPDLPTFMRDEEHFDLLVEAVHYVAPRWNEPELHTLVRIVDDMCK